MTGAELKEIRQKLKLSPLEMGRAFGYTGSDVTAAVTIRKYEARSTPLSQPVGRLAEMFDRHGVPKGWTELNVVTIETLKAAAKKAGVTVEYTYNRDTELGEVQMELAMWAPEGKVFGGWDGESYYSRIENVPISKFKPFDFIDERAIVNSLEDGEHS